jgi:2,4-dienoyl-CoA reductase-like NADH-dependent reductase (Old Yellow Enzyme family)
MSHNYPHLLSPGRIAGLDLRNRIVLAAMGSNFASEDGHCNERLIAYYEARAKGGAGLEDQLAGSGAQVHRIGDCRDKSFIDGAILDARKLVQEL